MTTAVLERNEVQQDSNVIGKIDFGLTPEQAKKKIEPDLALTINGVEDREGYKIADARRKAYVTLRNAIEKKKTELNRQAREHITRVGEVAEELQRIIAPAERHVTKLVDDVDAAIRQAEQDKRDAVFNARDAQLRHAGVILERIVVESLSDQQIQQKIDEAIELAQLRKAEAERQAAAEAERQRVAELEKEQNRLAAEKLAQDRAEFERVKAEQEAEAARLRKAEDDRIAAERAELDRQRQEQEAAARAIREQQEAAQRKLDEERERLEQQERERLAELERQRQVEYDRQLQAEQAKQKAAREESERLRAEHLKPIKEKLFAFADVVDRVTNELPTVAPELAAVRQLIFTTVTYAASKIRQIVAEQVK